MYHVKVKETGDKNHQLLGNGRLTRKKVHAITFEDQSKAEDAAGWVFDNNKEAIASTQVADSLTGKVVKQVRG